MVKVRSKGQKRRRRERRKNKKLMEQFQAKRAQRRRERDKEIKKKEGWKDYLKLWFAGLWKSEKQLEEERLAKEAEEAKKAAKNEIESGSDDTREVRQ